MEYVYIQLHVYLFLDQFILLVISAIFFVVSIYLNSLKEILKCADRDAVA